jgi:acyl carrier protein
VLEIEDRTIEMTDAFRDYDEWDSLARLSLIAEIDDVYNIVIEDEVFKNLLTLSDLYNEINKRTQA